MGQQTLAKVWVKVGHGFEIHPFDGPRNFAVEETPELAGIDDLARELDRLSKMRSHCVIRGEFVGPERAQTPEHPGYHRRLKANFDEVPRHWLMIDVDGFEDRAWSAVRDDPVAQIEKFIHTVLPECFHEVTYYWRLSGSAGKLGHESVLKAHIWFWLATPYDGHQLTAWKEMRAISIDAAVFRTVQVHYTADPLFSGCEDPIALRGGRVDRMFDEVPLVIEPHIVEAGARIRNQHARAGETQLADPSAKPGPIGAFHRAFTVEDVLERWLGDVFDYETPSEQIRLDFLQSASGQKGGAFITYDRMHICNTHNSDPFNGVATNLFDLVRHYRFGNLDDPDDPFDADPTTNPSYTAALALIKSLPEVQAELAKMDKERKAAEAEAAKKAVEDFVVLPLEQIKENWAEHAAQLPTIEAQLDLRKRLIPRLGITITEYNAIVKEARRNLQRAEALERAALRAGGREQLLHEPDREGTQAEIVEQLICDYVVGNDLDHEYFIFGGRPSRVVTDFLPETHSADGNRNPPTVPRISAYKDVTLQVLCEKVVVFERLDQTGKPFSVRIPQGIKDILINRDDHIPGVVTVTGLLTHPIVAPSGEILNRKGLHPDSHLLQCCAPVEGCRPYNLAEAREAIARLRRNYLVDFAFESELDEVAALAFLFTSVQRRILDMAPGIAILATNQSSGKTTLVRRTHVILTQQDLPVVSFPGREEEVQKTILSLLLASPALVCLDNIRDGRIFQSPSMAAVLTSSTYKQRILGASSEVSVPTNTTFTITGNNLQLGRDEDSRWLTVRLDTRSAEPEKRKFKHPDVVRHAREIREQVLRDVIGIVAGGLNHQSTTLPGTRYPRWEEVVRVPLIWVTGVDVAAVFDRNKNTSEERQERADFFNAIRVVMGEEWFAPKELLAAATVFTREERTEARSALEAYVDEFVLTAKGQKPKTEAASSKILAGRLRRMPKAEILGDYEFLLEERHDTDRDGPDFRVVRRLHAFT
jgi:hypothetical protein